MSEQETSAALVAVKQKNDKLVVTANQADPFAMLFDSAKFELLQRIAKVFSESDLIPAHFQKHMPNTLVAIHMAMRLGVDPLMFLQQSLVVNSTPGIRAQLVISLVNRSGLFVELDWEFKGKQQNDEWECECYATRKASGKRLTLSLTWAEVKAQGWLSRNNNPWLKQPAQMMRYRTAAMFARVYCPEVILGLYTNEELKDMQALDVTPDAEPKIEALNLKLTSALQHRTIETVNQETGEIKDAAPEIETPTLPNQADFAPPAPEKSKWSGR